ncbi:hypothetical protein E4K67_23415 [Desulfosporosinus fructosivorans]|uniref:NHLM bacteriocin system secretion protein n=1 Tax=Desulfosporosinus fructosivorans TaxID=2018669 RepID=A0A4Z0QYX3_9FIRM|nr:hypothetical protein [Desulfosporosinus fructosivorans]TGE35718.1 hypothetical protein E4K67_23415 [Desulfosporosinus fructosivorans]
MNESIFRKKSLDRVSSPEQLTDYIKVSSPSVWIVLSAVVILLISVLIWSVFGSILDTVKLNALVQDGVAVCYVDGDTAAKLKVGMTSELAGTKRTVSEISGAPHSAEDLRKTMADQVTAETLIKEEWNYPVKVNASGVPDGLYEMVITIDRVKPISFILN